MSETLEHISMNFEEKSPKKPTKNTTVKVIIISIIAIVLTLTIGFVTLIGVAVSNSDSKTIKTANKYYKEGKYQEAVLEFEKILEIEPNNLKAILGLANVHVELGEFDKAVELLDEKIETQHQPKLYDKLIEIHVENYDYPAAKATIKKAKENGYNYKINKLTKKQRDAVENAGNVFAIGEYDSDSESTTAEINSKLMTLDKSGLKVKFLDTGEEKFIANTDYDDNFATDGEVIYLYEKTNQKIVKINLVTGKKQEVVKKIKVPYEEEIPSDSNYVDWLSGRFMQFIKGYIFFEEVYGPESFKFFIIDTKTDSCKELKEDKEFAYYLEFTSYKNKIFGRCDWADRTYALMECDLNGENLIYIDDVTDFKVVTNVLYYAKYDVGLYTDYMDNNLKIVAKNLESGEINELYNGKNLDSFGSFTDLGYVVDDGFDPEIPDSQVTTIIIKYDGSKMEFKGRLESRGDKYIIYGIDNSYRVYYDGKHSQEFTLPEGACVEEFADGKVNYSIGYYYDNTYREKTITPVF